MASKRSGLLSIMEEFSQDTGAHAIPRVGDNSRKGVARILWAILFLVATGFCSSQVYELVTDFLKYPKNVEIKLEFRALPFPAVTVCNVNPLIDWKINEVIHFVVCTPK